MRERTAGILRVAFFAGVVVMAAGCTTPKCFWNDVRNLPQGIADGTKKTGSVLTKMDCWFRENLW